MSAGQVCCALKDLDMRVHVLCHKRACPHMVATMPLFNSACGAAAVDPLKLLLPEPWRAQPYFSKLDGLKGVPVINIHMCVRMRIVAIASFDKSYVEVCQPAVHFCESSDPSL